MSEPPATPPVAASPHGEAPRPPRRALRGIPSSRAYWELKAEQMMNRIFDPASTVDLPVEEAPAPPRRLLPTATVRTDTAAASKPPRRPSTTLLLFSLLAGVSMVSAVSTVLYLTSWNQAQQSLRQERNLLLVERLRSLGPANPAPVPAAPQLPAPMPVGLPDAATAPGDDLPPPPQEPWIEELSQLPDPERPAAPVLRVPLSPRLAAAAPPAKAPPAAPAPRAAPPTPVLVGVVAAAGRAGSAIFQVGEVTTSVGVGEAIGTSGWRLRSAASDTAEIERDGELRRVSISTGN